MDYRIEYQVYRRPFRSPLHTHHGVWAVREGMIVRLIDHDGRSSFGEIAPLPEFGSESLSQDLEWCQRLPQMITETDIYGIPLTLPACQFGFESALESFKNPERISQDIELEHNQSAMCCLLPTGRSALDAWQMPVRQGYHTLKWKIGVASVDEEIRWLETLMRSLPANVQLRLDANGGLTRDAAQRWMDACDRLSSVYPAAIEFVEQPLPPAQFEKLLTLNCQYQTPIALDESVATLAQLQACYEQGWRGIVVIKAAIAGFPSKLREFCQTHAVDVVWSSVFETTVARRFILKHLVPSLSSRDRALGFGVTQWFADSTFDQSDGDHLWPH
ncbi:MAG: o-succinylbenzoate synthase [Elainellaceae cyanobacterium]